MSESVKVEKKELPPLSFYLNADLGYKVPINGVNAPKGPFADFRFGFNKSVYEFADKKGFLSANFGMWDHSPINQMSGSKIRWWLGFGYNNPNWLGFFIEPRVYAGVVPDNKIGMIAIAGAAGIKPMLYQNLLGIEASYFGVFHEKYYGVPKVEGKPILESGQFHIATIAPFLKFNDLTLKLLAQLWYINLSTSGNNPEPTLHLQLGAGLTGVF